jgi:hypothetical protein
MNRAERANDKEEAIRTALTGWQAGIWTALPGVVQSFDPAKMTAKVQPAVMGRLTLPNGQVQDLVMPTLLDCPVQFPGGGGFSLTFPVKAGDECLVVFASRCIDNWWYYGSKDAQGNITSQPLAELRMHDLSDGFVILGFRSVPRVLGAVSTTATQLRADDGAAFVEVAPGGLVNVKGDLHVTGAVIAGYGTGDQVGLQTHRHDHVTLGTALSDAPKAGT